MDRIDLDSEEDRLQIARRLFAYPTEPHQRRHGPQGYTSYDSYREWLRDEFAFRCVYTLIRETWIGRKANFDIDHFEPQASNSDRKCDYDNLLYVTHRTNLVRGTRSLPDPTKVALGSCLWIDPETGEIQPLNEIGERMILILKLDSADATAQRLNWLRILRFLAISDIDQFRTLIGYPSELRDFSRMRVEGNSRPNGISASAYARRNSGTLPDWY
jgi:hypothetical protein